MYLKQGDLFWGMDTDFVKEAMDATTKEHLEEGQVVFREGDPAESFYILVKGRIKLTLGEKSREVYVAYQPRNYRVVQPHRARNPVSHSPLPGTHHPQ
jgi:CRP-like cAMP-binding protein